MTNLIPIKEAAAQIGVVPQTIRQWECKYKLVRATRSEAGHRLYDLDEVEKMRKIVELIRCGLSIEQIQQQVGQTDRAVGKTAE